jgi:hypothetical protein
VTTAIGAATEPDAIPVEAPVQAKPPEPGANVLHDVFLVYYAPVRVFANLPRINRSAKAAVLLIALQALGGWLLWSTGVYAYESDVATEHAVVDFIKKHEGDDDVNAAADGADAIEKAGAFQKSVACLAVVAGGPIATLASIGLLGGVLFASVALGGGKPKYALLAGIPIFAFFVEVPRLALKLYLVAQTHASRVETSLAALASKLGGKGGVDLGTYLLLRRFDPFDLWFWLLFALGAHYAARMSVRKSVILTASLAFMGAIGAALADVGTYANIDLSTGQE